MDCQLAECAKTREQLDELVKKLARKVAGSITHRAPRAVQLLGLDGIVYALDDAGHVWRLEGAIENEKINVWWSQLPAFPPAAGSVERG